MNENANWLHARKAIALCFIVSENILQRFSKIQLIPINGFSVYTLAIEMLISLRNILSEVVRSIVRAARGIEMTVMAFISSRKHTALMQQLGDCSAKHSSSVEFHAIRYTYQSRAALDEEESMRQ